eukprot:scaffold1356_cov123-Cylindrotheca_fusiformis.AAC.9
MSETVNNSNLGMSPTSSFCSDSSSCRESSPPRSPSGLRRSTIDLSRFNCSDHSSETRNCSRIKSTSCSSRVRTTSDDCSSPKEFSRRHGHGTITSHRGIESIIEDILLDPLRLLDVGNLCAAVLSIVSNSDKTENARNENICASFSGTDNATEGKKLENAPDVDLYSPCQVKVFDRESDGDWDFFADFQEQIGDNLSFTPFTKKSSKVLATLNESDEESESEDTEWF